MIIETTQTFLLENMMDENDNLRDVLTVLAVLESCDRHLFYLIVKEMYPQMGKGIFQVPLLAQNHSQTLNLASSYKTEFLADLESKPAEHETLCKKLLLTMSKYDALYSKLTAIFERLLTHQTLHAPTSLGSTLHWAEEQKLPLDDTGQQWLAYFKGVAAYVANEYAKAIRLFENLLQTSSLPLVIEGRCLNSLALSYYGYGDIEHAFARSQACLTIWEQLADPLSHGKALVSAGIFCFELRRYDQSLSYLKLAHTCFEQINHKQWVANVENELGLVLRDQGEWEQALAHFRRARNTESSTYAGHILNNIGEVQLLQGNVDEAIVSLEGALQKFSHTDRYRVDSWLFLSLALQIKGDLPMSQVYVNEAYRYSQNHWDLLPQVCLRQAQLARLRGELDTFEHFCQEGIAEIEKRRQPISDDSLKISLIGRWQQIYEELILHFCQQGKVEEGWSYSERIRARALNDAIEKQQDDSTLTVNDVQSHLRSGEVVLAFFTTGVLDQDAPYLQKLASNNPLRTLLLTSAVTLLFIITRKTFRVVDCHFDPNHFVPGAARRHAPERWLEPSIQETLFKLLFGMVSEIVGANHLYLIPHGPLHYIPLTAILSSHLPQAASMSYAPNVRMLQTMLNTNVQDEFTENYLGISFAGSDDKLQLRYATEEINQIQALWEEGEVLAGIESLEEIRLKFQAAKWLHIACHGWFNHGKPLDSYLEIGNGIHLTANAVMGWQIQAKLVVLSACQTGVSRVLRGDETMGLVRAFLMAGAKAVLVTQWAVDDLATYFLIGRFFEEIRAHPEQPLAEALLTAQMWLRLANRDSLVSLVADSAELPEKPFPYTDPLYWAAFNLVGVG